MTRLRLCLCLLLCLMAGSTTLSAQVPANCWDFKNAEESIFDKFISDWHCVRNKTSTFKRWVFKPQPVSDEKPLPEDLVIDEQDVCVGIEIPESSKDVITAGYIESAVIPNGMSRLCIVYNARDSKDGKSDFKVDVKLSSIFEGKVTERVVQTIDATFSAEDGYMYADYLGVLEFDDIKIERGAKLKIEVGLSSNYEGYFTIVDLRWDDALADVPTYPDQTQIDNVVAAHDYAYSSDELAVAAGVSLADRQSVGTDQSSISIEPYNRVWLTTQGGSLVKEGEHTVLAVEQGGALTVNTMDKDNHRLALQAITIMHDGDEAFDNGSCTNPGEHHWNYVTPKTLERAATGPQRVTFTASRPVRVYAVGVSQPAIVTGVDNLPMTGTDDCAHTTYYNLQGQRVSAPKTGQTVIAIIPGQPASKVVWK